MFRRSQGIYKGCTTSCYSRSGSVCVQNRLHVCEWFLLHTCECLRTDVRADKMIALKQVLSANFVRRTKMDTIVSYEC